MCLSLCTYLKYWLSKSNNSLVLNCFLQLLLKRALLKEQPLPMLQALLCNLIQMCQEPLYLMILWLDLNNNIWPARLLIIGIWYQIQASMDDTKGFFQESALKHFFAKRKSFDGMSVSKWECPTPSACRRPCFVVYPSETNNTMDSYHTGQIAPKMETFPAWCSMIHYIRTYTT